MTSKLTRAAYEQLIAEDLVWLDAQPRTLEREHIREIVRLSPMFEYVPTQRESLDAQLWLDANFPKDTRGDDLEMYRRACVSFARSLGWKGPS